MKKLTVLIGLALVGVLTHVMAQETLKVTKSIDGGIYRPGGLMRIEWKAYGLTRKNNSVGVNIYRKSADLPGKRLLSVTTANLLYLDGEVSNSGRYVWYIPADAPLGSDYVVYLAAGGSWTISETFEIAAPAIAVTTATGTPEVVVLAAETEIARFNIETRPALGQLQYESWQMNFEVSPGFEVENLGTIKVIDTESGKLVSHWKINHLIAKGDRQKGVAIFDALHPLEVHPGNFMLKEPSGSLSVVADTTELGGAVITVTSVQLVVSCPSKNFEIDSYTSDVTTEVKVEAKLSQPEEPIEPKDENCNYSAEKDEFVVVNMPYEGQKQLAYLPEKEVGKTMWCVVFLENPAPAGFNRLVWDTPNYKAHYDTQSIHLNATGTIAAFRLPEEFAATEPNALLLLSAEIRFFQIIAL
ncbi:MAG: hypothetical protein Q8P52_03590 [bacterium]|nr:hypothetical protein [bacterium]